MALTDIELVVLAKASQSSDAFAELVRRHQAGLRAFLRKFTHDDAYADDLAQEALIKAYRGLTGFEGGASFRSWLYRIAWREYLQARRKRDADERLSGALALDANAPTGAGADIRLDLQRALSSLEEDERAAILLCDAAGMSHAEAANALGAPLGTVKSQIARARDKLRAALEAGPRPASGQSQPAPAQ